MHLSLIAIVALLAVGAVSGVEDVLSAVVAETGSSHEVQRAKKAAAVCFPHPIIHPSD